MLTLDSLYMQLLKYNISVTVKDAYYEFSLLLNKNSERKDINIDKLNYYVLYNRESKRWLAEFIERNNNSDNILTISELLVSNYELVRKQTNKESIEYEIPDNYFKLLTGKSYSTVKSTKCNVEGVVYNWFKKPNDWNIQTEDKFTAPSFSWERGLADISQNTITIYKTDFEILSSFISFYEKPVEINLLNPDVDLDLKLSNFLIGQINDRIVSEVYREFNSPGFNMAKSRETITV